MRNLPPSVRPVALRSSFRLSANCHTTANIDFAIHDGDRVVLYGDSITDQRLYSTFIEEYVLTRFPTWKVQWTQSGVGGDKVSGGAAGPIDLRIQRDILPYGPTS